MNESFALDIKTEKITDTVDNHKENNGESKPAAMSHQEALEFVAKGMADIIKTDPLLKYLPSSATLEELNSMLALEHGRAMTVIVHRADGQSYSVVVEQKATVMDLKKAIQRHVELKLKREGCGRTLSWRYVWKTYWLYHEGEKLTQDDKPLKDYQIKNNSE
ncbi:U11/U12 small nuclear ribonucleoprotein, partial [Stegodyphus mimosarum]